ncbi:hypothetical protein NHH03_09085 [Stieleria sp. TO1_6]|uniref:hypothetical protein n=1 Tax=Stieleria tagensis TaxID=2956795 RepID=UPI00209ADC00|nr:hypothetical protein [Stieleria tagensis]MCO8121888.1 hypothetical protein [Stieleria tagensis]
MKLHSILLALLFTSTGIATAAENVMAEKVGTPKPMVKTQYLVELSEYELEQAVPVAISESEIIDVIRRSKSKPLETVRMTAVEETDSMVQNGRRVTVTTGKVTHGNTTSRSTEQLEVGTMLRVKIVPHAKGALADVSYATSRLDGNGTDVSPPDVLTKTIESTQIYVLGKERLLSSMSADKFTCVLISVSEIP